MPQNVRKLEALEAFGDFPPVLYRLFSEEKWARAFVEEGRIRMRLVRYFAKLEADPRADPAEGKAHLRVPSEITSAHFVNGEYSHSTVAPGLMNYSGEFINPVYIYCFAYPPDGDLSKLPRKFGNHLVLVRDPRRLAQDMTDWLTEEGVLPGSPVVECRAVRYDKGQVADRVPDHLERARMNFLQKPECYADEYEYRFAVIASPRTSTGDPSATDHEVVLGKRLEYAEYVGRMEET